MKIELVYEQTCPNVDAARERLAIALGQVQRDPVWQEWEVSSPDAPEYVRPYGSPTILVNETDVSEMSLADSCNNCRVYQDEQGKLDVVPSIDSIINALAKAPAPANV